MTSTVTAATMTVKIVESITLNGDDHGSTNTLTIASINEVMKRIVTVTTTEQIVRWMRSLRRDGITQHFATWLISLPMLIRHRVTSNFS
jgi:hypothetical protein